MSLDSNILPSDRCPIEAVIDPVSQGVGAVSTGWVSMADANAIMATLQVGALGAAATVDAKLQQAQDNAGTGAKDIAGKAITQLTKVGVDDNKQVELNCFAQELDRDNAFTFVRLTVTVAAAACLIAAHVRSFDARYQPLAPKATVDEVIS